MNDWDLLTDLNDVSSIVVRSRDHGGALAQGEVRLRIESFALTANNITYGIVGDRMGYWQFFPAEPGYGRIPAWGFAIVEDSRADDVIVGTRLYGYWPMSTRIVTRLRRTRNGAVDVSPHRAGLAAAYNSYADAPPALGDDHRALLGPLFTTAFLLDDYLLADRELDGATPVLASASSKTALGLASLLKARNCPAIGLTSMRNKGFVVGTGYYASVLTYEEVDLLPQTVAVYIDFAGSSALRLAVHTRLAMSLRASVIIGSTHHTTQREQRSLPGPVPAFFFAPDRVGVRLAEWGAVEYNRRVEAALRAFVEKAAWLDVSEIVGPEALATAYTEVFEGQSDPAKGLIVRPA